MTGADAERSSDPRWDGSEPRLVAAIRSEIMAAPGQRITFARFMQRALSDPAVGYYASSELRPTRGGDFLTAPELHPFFGHCIGRFVAGAHEAIGAPTPLRVREFGAGRGTLRDHAVAVLDIDVEWTRVDLPDRSDVAGGPPHIVIANEYLDALPVHRLVRRGQLREAYVGWADDWFTETLAEPSTPELAAYLEADGVEIREGQRAEVCLAAGDWMAHVAETLTPGGVVLVIDYGHEAAELYGPRRMAGSLLTYREHQVADAPFEAVGHTDITAHVDITALERVARQSGLELIGATTQGPFLARLGLGQLLADLGRRPETQPRAYLEARSSVARLLDPRHLGAFRVLAWARPAADGTMPVLPGLADTP
ncbi:MAG TPA: SAM-dependent methyltransferase [Anaerolineae bacterium]|nr:SAM-dependent methyltransferase [Anaerolineae bacterium]